jgi:hypothetical protein
VALGRTPRPLTLVTARIEGGDVLVDLPDAAAGAGSAD